MFRFSVIILGVMVIVLAAMPFGHAYTATRGNIERFSGGACMPTGCPPISASAYPGPAFMPAKISKCKVPQTCAPIPCGPPPCAPMPCAPACTIWYEYAYFIFGRCLRGCPVRDSRFFFTQVLATASPPRRLFLRHEYTQVIPAVARL